MKDDSMQPRAEREELLNLLQVAEIFAIHRTTSWRWIVCENKIPYCRLSDGTVRVARKDVLEYLEQSLVGRR